MNDWISIDKETTKMAKLLGSRAEVINMLEQLNSVLLVGVEPHKIATMLEHMKSNNLAK